MGLIRRKKLIAHSTKPIPRKRAKPRTWKTPRCDVRGCRKPQDVKWGEVEYGAIANATGALVYGFGMCRAHAEAEAHTRVREFVRKRDGGRCVVPHPFPCSATWQPNHGFDRDEKSCTWAEWNVLGGCSALNTWAHHHKARWYAMLRDLWGKELYEERWEIMLHGDPMNVAEVLARYPARLARYENSIN